MPGDEDAAEDEQGQADLTFVPKEHFVRECRALIGLVQAELRRLEAMRSRRAHVPAAAALPSASALLGALRAAAARTGLVQGCSCSAVRVPPLWHHLPPCLCRAAPLAGERTAGQAERAQAEAAQAEAALLERRLTVEQLERVVEIAEGIDVGYSLLSGQDALWGEPSELDGHRHEPADAEGQPW